jgi:hypothetical protein
LELPPSITTTSRNEPLTIQFNVQWSLMERGHPVRLSAKRELHLEYMSGARSALRTLAAKET